MKQLDKHIYGPWALVAGASSGIGEEFARQEAVVKMIKERLAASRPAH